MRVYNTHSFLMMEIPCKKCIEFGKVIYLPLKLKWGYVFFLQRLLPSYPHKKPKKETYFSANMHCLHDNLHFGKEYVHVLVHLCFPGCFDQSNDYKIQSRRRLSSHSCSWRELGPCEYHSCHSVLGGTEKMGLAVQVPQQKGKQGAIPNHCKSVKSPWTEMLAFKCYYFWRCIHHNKYPDCFADV